MFTGLIREFAKVKSYDNETLSLFAKYKPKIGDSIAINGVCLTAVEVFESGFSVELSHETRKKIAHENLKGFVHMEPAMRLSDRLDGHIVQGHVDGIGEIISIKKDENAYDFTIRVPKELMALMIPKGSVTIDGVSLTVNEVFQDSIRLTIIPHTFEKTLFSKYKKTQRVNIESDMFARYIFYMLKGKRNLSWDDVDKIMSMY